MNIKRARRALNFREDTRTSGYFTGTINSARQWGQHQGDRAVEIIYARASISPSRQIGLLKNIRRFARDFSSLLFRFSSSSSAPLGPLSLLYFLGGSFSSGLANRRPLTTRAAWYHRRRRPVRTELLGEIIRRISRVSLCN